MNGTSRSFPTLNRPVHHRDTEPGGSRNRASDLHHLDGATPKIRPGRFLVMAMSLGLTVILGCSNGTPPTPAAQSTPDVPAVSVSSAADTYASDSGIDLAWIPRSTKLIIQVRVAELENSPLVRQLRSVTNIGQLPLPGALGLSSGVESFTIALDDVDRFLSQSKGSAAGNEMLTLLRSREPVDQSRMVNDPDLEPVANSAIPVFRRRNPMRKDVPEMLAVPEPTLILTGSAVQVKAALQTGTQPANSPNGKPPRPKGQIFLWGHARSAATLAERLTTLLPQGLSSLLHSLADLSQDFSLKLDVSQDIDLGLSIRCTGAVQATQFTAQLQNLMQQAQSNARDNSARLGEAASIVRTTFSTAKISQDEMTARLALHVPFAPLERLLFQPTVDASQSPTPSTTAPFGAVPLVEDLRHQAVPAVVAEGLPQGAKLLGAIRWGDTSLQTGPAALTPAPLEFVLMTVEGVAPDIVSLGKPKIVKAVLKDGLSLKRRRQGFMKPNESQLQPVDRELFYEHPEDGVALTVPFHHPVNGSPSLSELRGEFSLGIAGRTLDKQIANLRDWIDKRIEDEDLRGAGLRVVLVDSSQPGSSPTYRLTLAKDHLLLGLAVGEPGSLAERNAVVSSTLSPGGRTVYEIQFTESPLPNPVPVRFQLASDISERRVEFQFLDVPVPSHPELTVDQRAMVSWRQSQEQLESLPHTLVQGRLRWSQAFGFGAQGAEASPPLELAVDLVGDAGEHTVAFGKSQITTADTEIGPLALHGNVSPYELEAREQLIAVDRSLQLDDFPPDGFQVVYSFTPPAAETKSVTVSGKFTMVTAASQHVISIPKVSTVGRSIVSHPLLEDANLKLLLLRHQDSLTVSLLNGPPELLDKIELLDSAGDPFPGVFGACSSFGGTIEYSFQSTGAFPDEVQLQVTLNTGLEYHDIPFRFVDLTVPPTVPSDEPGRLPE